MRNYLISIAIVVASILYLKGGSLQRTIDSDSLNATLVLEVITTSAKSLQYSIARYIKTTNSTPSSLEAMGLDVSDLTTSNLVEAIRMEDGTIYMKGQGRLGDQTVIVLMPDLSAGTYSIKWKCMINAKVRQHRELNCVYTEGLKY